MTRVEQAEQKLGAEAPAKLDSRKVWEEVRKRQAEHKPGWLERFAICNETNEDVVGMFIGLGILLVGSENWGMWRAIIAVATWGRLFI